MSKFAETYPKFFEKASAEESAFGFDVAKLAGLAPALRFLYEAWWKVDLTGLNLLPPDGPALIVGNSGSVLPWPAMMLLFALMSNRDNPRRLSILADMDWINDERMHRSLLEIGFVPWSADHAKRLFAQGQIVAAFPEGLAGLSKPFSERYRLRPLDWTKFLPAVEERVPIFPLATVGCDEAVPVIANLEGVARFLNLPSFPLTPFFPWLPFPACFASLPVKWTMHVMKSCPSASGKNRHELEDAAKHQAEFLEGEIQAELNRMLRTRIKSPF